MNRLLIHIRRPLLLLAFLHGALLAQESFVIRSFPSAPPETVIYCLFQDRQGFIWFGGWNGLYRYDGYRFLRFYHDPADTYSLSNSMVYSIAEDALGNLWVGTDGGINQLDPRTGHFTAFPLPPGIDGIPDLRIRAVFVDSRNCVWAGTLSGQLYRLDLATLNWTYFPTKQPDPDAFVGGVVRAFQEDGQGYLWIGTMNGLSRFDYATERFLVFQNNPLDPYSLSHNYVWSIFQDDEGVLWIGTNGGGVNRFDRETGRFTRFRHEPGNPESLSHDGVFGFSQDNSGRLWVATHGGGLNYLDRRTGRCTAYTQQSPSPFTLTQNGLYALLKDRQGLIWMAGTGSLNRLDFQSKPFTKYLHQIEPALNPSRLMHVSAVLEDAAGILWVGTETEGLIRLDRKSGQINRYRHDPRDPNSLADDWIWALAEDRAGGLLVGHRALDRLDRRTGQFTHYRHDPDDSTSLRPGTVRHLHKDKSGQIWINSSDATLQLFDESGDRFFSFREEETNQCCIGGVCAMAEDRQGVFWMTTWGKGLHRWDRKNRQLTQFRYDPANPDGPASDQLLDLLYAGDGSLWMYAIGSGLNRLDPKTGRFTLYTQKDGLSNEQVMGILEDNRQRLWISTKDGLSCYDPTTGAFQRFDVADGLPSDEFLFYSRYRNPHTGELFFGTANGLLAFHPDSIQIDTLRPPVVFTSFSRYNRRQSKNEPIVDEWISRKESITLTHRDNVLAFEFAALSFRNPEGAQYAYQLEGFSDQWVQLGAKRDVMFTNLAPGSYTLRVKASNDDGVWNEEGAALELIVQPPWYWNWRSKLFYVLLLAGLAFTVYRFLLQRRLALAEAKRMKELDAFKNRVYTNISHEFRTPLTVILGMAEDLQTKADETVKSSLDLIRRNGRQLLNLVSQMLDLSKVESGEMKLHMTQGDVLTYLRYLAESFHSLAASKNIRLHFLTELPELNMDYDPERLQQILSNLLSNAIKFTPEGGDVYLFADQADAKLEIRVKDTGAGIPESHLPHVFDRFFQGDDDASAQSQGTGIGLALTRELVYLLRGEISVAGKPGDGAEFTVLLPITQTAEQRPVIPPQRELQAEYVPLPAAIAYNPHGQAPLLLIVEDNHDVVKYLLACLQADYRIEVAYNGRQGVEKAVELTPDLIVSDVMMPQMDGFELCHALKTDERASHMPIIVLTARADMESKLSGLRRGADAYLAKPFDRQELLAHIHNLLEVRRKLRAHYLVQAGLPAGKQEASPVQTSLESALEHAFIRKVRALIEADLTRQWPAPELARQLYVSPSQLHRKLEGITGMHTTEFVRFVRLSRAAEWLQSHPEEKISAIAYEVGFTSPNEFTRRFGEVFGRTPGEWRKDSGHTSK